MGNYQLTSRVLKMRLHGYNMVPMVPMVLWAALKKLKWVRFLEHQTHQTHIDMTRMSSSEKNRKESNYIKLIKPQKINEYFMIFQYYSICVLQYLSISIISRAQPMCSPAASEVSQLEPGTPSFHIFQPCHAVLLCPAPNPKPRCPIGAPGACV